MDGHPPLPPARAVELAGRGRARVYDTGGPGRPLLLLHGWTSTAALNWYPTFPALADAGYRVVALDQRGHGHGIRSRLPFRLEACADDAAALVELLGAGPVTAVGYSMGGPVAQLLWRRHPQVVGELVLCATAASFPWGGQMHRTVGSIGLGASVAFTLLPSAVRRGGMNLAIRRRQESAAWVLDEWRSHDLAALVQAGVALSRFDSTRWIGGVDVPTAVVLTERDQTVPPARQRDLAALVPGSLCFPVDGDHRVCVDEPEMFLPALLDAVAAVRREYSMPQCPAT